MNPIARLGNVPMVINSDSWASDVVLIPAHLLRIVASTEYFLLSKDKLFAKKYSSDDDIVKLDVVARIPEHIEVCAFLPWSKTDVPKHR